MTANAVVKELPELFEKLRFVDILVSVSLMHMPSTPLGSVEKTFRNLAKPLEWRSFYNNDLPLLIDFCEEFRVGNQPYYRLSHVSSSRRLYEPEATQRFQAKMVSRMQKNRILGVVRRSLIVGKKK